MNSECKPNLSMVGVSTQQNTTNLVPFIQSGCGKLYLFETDGAKEKQWSQGLINVLESKRKEVVIIPASSGDSLGEMIGVLQTMLNQEDALCWNMGGGQKMQKVALLSVFLRRIADGKGDWACYSDPQARKTYRIISEKGKMESYPDPTDVFLDINEILAVFGRRADGKSMNLLWEKGRSDCPHLPRNMEYIMDFQRRQAMFDYTLRMDNKEVLPDEKPPFPEPHSNFGSYFESCVQQQAVSIISKNPESHCINQVWSNARVFNVNTNEELAEYDVVLVTNFGTLIPLDAKTYNFQKKDEHARLLNLAQASGGYTTLWSVFPYFQADLEKHSILQREKKWKTLLHQPFELRKRGSNMLGMAEPGLKEINVVKKSKGKIQLPAGPVDRDKQVSISTLENMIETLGLACK